MSNQDKPEWALLDERLGDICRRAMYDPQGLPSSVVIWNTVQAFFARAHVGEPVTFTDVAIALVESLKKLSDAQYAGALADLKNDARVALQEEIG